MLIHILQRNILSAFLPAAWKYNACSMDAVALNIQQDLFGSGGQIQIQVKFTKSTQGS